MDTEVKWTKADGEVHIKDHCALAAVDAVGMEKSFEDIPVSSQLNIFSYLDVCSLCHSAQVCKLWRTLTNDPVLWEKKLRFDVMRWHVIDHLSHPQTHQNHYPDLTPKEIYVKCCPEFRSIEKESIAARAFQQFLKMRVSFGFSVPRIIMFGSGLNDTGLVSRIMTDPSSPFTVQGMFPGRFDGMGSGVTLRYDEGTINLITLYGLPKAERESGRVDSKLLHASESGEITLSDSVRQLCGTVDCFIFAVDCLIGTHDETFRAEEFRAMIDERWLQPKVQVLVLCVVPDGTHDAVSSLDIADKLDLANLSRPWQVRQCHVSSLYGFIPGLKWVTSNM